MKVGLVFYGTRGTRDTVNLDEHRLGPTAQAFRAEGIDVEPCVYNDDFADEVREQMLGLNGVQVWVNPIMEDGRDRTRLDALLTEVADAGVYVTSHPDTIQRMGTKDVLYKTRDMGWGSDVHMYRSAEDMLRELPGRVKEGPRVLKQFRGHSGQGVWRVSVSSDPDRLTVKHAARGSAEEQLTYLEWADRCRAYFATGPMLDQEYNPRILEGTVRCYLVGRNVQGFGHQEVNALVPGTDPGPRLYSPPDDPRFQQLKNQLEGEWLPQMLAITGVVEERLPMLWDTDFMLRDGGGYMLCEINISSVYPYPESAMRPLARAFAARLMPVKT